MKKLLTLILLFTITLFLSGNQIVIANDYNFIISNQEGFDFTDGTLLNDAKYQRTNKIAITNDTVIADRLKYHYVFFWDEADAFLGYYKTSKAPITSGTFLGQVNTNNIPLPLNAYSFALVRYDNDYVLVGNYTVKDLFIDNNLTYDALPDFNEIPIPELNGLTLNEVFDDGVINNNAFFENGTTGYLGQNSTISIENGMLKVVSINPDVYGFRYDNNIPNNFTAGDIVYYIFDIIPTVTFTNLRLRTAFATGSITPVDQLDNTAPFTYYKNVITTGLPNHFVQNIQSSFTAGDTMFVKSVLTYNLTALGIANLNQAQMDRYYELYENPINFIYYKHADTPTGELSSVNNYYYAAGKNLYNLSFISFFQVSDGILLPAGTPHTTSPIAVLENTTYTISGGSRTAFRFLDENFNLIGFINNITQTTPRTITTIDNTYYMTVYYSNDGTHLNTFQLEENNTATTFEAYAPPDNLLNLTLLFGVGNEPDLATMDTYYDAYDEYLNYTHILPLAFTTISIQFQTTFFDDGVSEQIETLGLILTFTLIAFTLMIFGFISNRRIFNLLSIGAFVVLGVFLIEFIGFIIILFGLIFINVYYTFFGEL